MPTLSVGELRAFTLDVLAEARYPTGLCGDSL